MNYIKLTGFILFTLMINLIIKGQNVLSNYNLKQVTEKHDKIFEHLTTTDGLSSSKINCIFQDSEGFIWFGTDNGLNRYDGYTIIDFKNIKNDSSSLSNNFITCIVEDTNANLWIGTKNGLNQYHKYKRDFTRFVQKDYDENSVPGNFIRALYVDNLNNLWIETLNGNLTRYDIQKNIFKQFRHKPYHSVYPKNYLKHFIVPDQKNNLWIGSRNIGVLVFNTIREEFTNIYRNNITSEGYKGIDNLSSHNATSLYIDKNGNYLFGSSSDELNILDKETGLFYKFDKLDGVSSIVEDNKGVIWFGTSSDGVYCYNTNTKELTQYKHNPNDENSLLNNTIYDIFIDNSGIVWIANKGGVSKFSYLNNQFKQLYHIAGNKNSISENYITSILEQDNGDIWIGTLQHGLDILNPANSTYQHLSIHTNQKLLSNKVSALFEDSSSIYIGQMAGIGFNIYNKATQKIEAYKYMPNSTRKDWYKGFSKVGETIVVGMFGGVGLAFFDPNKKVFLPQHYNKAINTYKNMAVYRLAVDSKNQIWLGGTNYYLLKIDPDSKKYQLFYDKATKDNELNYYHNLGLTHLDKGSEKYLDVDYIDIAGYKTNISGLFNDVKNKFWIITQKGLAKYSPIEKKFTNYSYYPIIKVGNSYSEYRLWGFSEKGFFIFYPETEKFETFDELKNIDAGILVDLLEDAQKNLWIATNKGMIKYNIPEKKIIRYNEDSNSAAYLNNNIRNILYSPEGIWIATDENICYYNYSLNNLDDSKKIRIKNVNKIVVMDSHLWLASDNGLWKYDLTSGEKKVFKHKPQIQNTIISNQVLNMIKDDNNNLWIGTDIGFCFFDTKTETFLSFNVPGDNAISSFLTSCVLTDSKNNIWVGTQDKGIYCIHSDNNEISYYYHSDYETTSLSEGHVSVIYEDLQGKIWAGTNSLNLFDEKTNRFNTILSSENELPGNIKGIQEDDNDNLWISTSNGLVKFNKHTKQIHLYTVIDGLPGNEFTKASCSTKTGQMYFGGTKGIVYFNPDSIKTNLYVPPIVITSFKVYDTEKTINPQAQDEIILNYDENFFSFEFAALDYTSPQQNQFKYILKAYDKKWSNVQTKRVANYTKVSPGEYTFIVKGSNSDGIWNNTGKKIKIIIKPPFWRTWWFILVIFLIITYSGYMVINHRFIRLSSQKNALLLEQKLLRSQMHPHFIFNSLTAIQSFIYKNNPEQAGRYLSKFARLMRLILDNSRTELISLETEITTLENYLELQKLRFTGLFNYKIHIDENLDREITLIPPMLAQPFIENAIEHGMKEKKETGNIYISFKQNANYIVYCIEDDGIGILKSKQYNQQKDKKHRSLATKITRERVLAFNKINTQKITLEIIDLSTLQKNKTGTRVCFTIPLITA